MYRLLYIAESLLLAVLFCLLVFLHVKPPARAELLWVEEQVAAIEPSRVEFPQPQWDFAKWHQAIIGKQSLWQRIVPPKAPPPKKEEPPPDLAEKLKGVQPTRAQIGGKVQLKTAENGKGAFYAVGDEINGLKIKSITKESVEFSLVWREQELTTSLPRK